MTSWPRQDYPDIRTLLGKNHADVSLADENTVAQLADGIATSPLRGPSSGDIPAGDSFSVPADATVDGKLLDAAARAVRWLVVRFDVGEADRWATAAPRFPSWVLRLRDLRGLCLEGYPHASLPEEVGWRLSRLEQLHCRGSALERVPRSIGRLRNILVLNLGRSHRLRYLPFEVVHCRNLRESSLSPRTPFTNGNGLPLPPLDPWWERRSDGRAICALTREDAHNILAGTESGRAGAVGLSLFSLPADVLDRCLLPFLRWNFCSVCGAEFIHGMGCHAWSRRRVATNTPMLFAFCCSASCAAQIPKQLWFDPTSGANVPVPRAAFSSSANASRLVDASARRARWEICWNAHMRLFVSRREGWLDTVGWAGLESWTEEHLRPWPPGSPPPMDLDEIGLIGSSTPLAVRSVGTSSGTAAVEDQARSLSPGQTVRVAWSCSFWDRPSSNSREAGRLRAGEYVYIKACCRDGNGQEFVRFCRQGSSFQRRGRLENKPTWTISCFLMTESSPAHWRCRGTHWKENLCWN